MIISFEEGFCIKFCLFDSPVLYGICQNGQFNECCEMFQNTKWDVSRQWEATPILYTFPCIYTKRWVEIFHFSR